MYDSDVTEAEWKLVQAYLQPTDKRGAVPKHDKRAIVNAIFYLNKTGCHWRLLPNDFPPWQTGYDHWRRWNRRGAWENMLDGLNTLHRKKTASSPPRVMALSIRKVLRPSMPAKDAAMAMTVTRRRKGASATS